MALCKLPWQSLEIRTDGSVAACCLHQDPLKDASGKALSIGTHSLAQIQASPELESLKENLSAGKKDPRCQRCWTVEAAGAMSRRNRYQVPAKGLTVLDLKLGNTCNLKCRICGPKSSSLWKREFEEVYGVQQNDFEFTKEIEEKIYKILPNLERLEVSGGEPFLNLSHKRIFQSAIEQEVAHKQLVQITTNGTVYPEVWLDEIFPKFKEVKIFLSLDGTGAQFEYQRHPARWNEVLTNYRRFRDSPYFAGIVLTLSALNIFYLPEYLNFWQNAGETRIFPNLLLEPQELSLRAIPLKARREICQRLFAAELRPEFRAIAEFAFTSLAKEKEYIPGLLQKILVHDQFRKERFAKTFPEYAALIEEKSLQN